MILTEQQRRRLSEIEQGVKVTWHQGQQDITQVAREQIIAYAHSHKVRLVLTTAS